MSSGFSPGQGFLIQSCQLWMIREFELWLNRTARGGRTQSAGPSLWNFCEGLDASMVLRWRLRDSVVFVRNMGTTLLLWDKCALLSASSDKSKLHFLREFFALKMWQEDGVKNMSFFQSSRNCTTSLQIIQPKTERKLYKFSGWPWRPLDQLSAGRELPPPGTSCPSQIHHPIGKHASPICSFPVWLYHLLSRHHCRAPELSPCRQVLSFISGFQSWTTRQI